MSNNIDFKLKNAVEVGGPTKVTLGSITSGDIDLSTGNYFADTPSGTSTYTISNAGDVQSFQLEVTGGGSGYGLSDAVFDNVTASISQVGDERGLAFSADGTKFYVLDGNTPQSVFQYNLSTAWDLSTSSYSNNSFNISSQETQPTGVTFKTDGTKMYVTGYTGDDVNEYSLSTAWDVSTASFVTNFSVSSQTTFTGDLFFKPDGLTFYICGASDLYQYTLSSAWDISTASYASKTVAILERDGLHFKNDGTEFFASGSGTDAVYKYNMSTAWDISTASYSNVSFSLASQDTFPKGLVFKDDGTKMYVTGVIGTDVNQYTTLGPTTLTWPSSIEWAGGVAPSAPATGETDVFTFVTDDSGTSYVGLKTADNLS